MLQSELGQIQAQSLTDQICAHLSREIVRFKLRPDQHLGVQELARKFNTSETPVKEALQRLAGQGLVEIIPNRGAFVRSFSDSEVLELLEIRLMLETRAARLLVADPDLAGPAVDRLETIVQRSPWDEKEPDYDAFASADHDFHSALVESAHRLPLTEVYRFVLARANTVRIYFWRVHERARDSAREHRRILDSLRSGDVGEVETALFDHFAKVRQDFVRNSDGSPGTG